MCIRDRDTDDDEASDLSLGFSTTRFDDQYWARDDGALPFRYKFELERTGIDPGDHPHFFAYRVHQEGVDIPELVWSSAEAEVKDMAMAPGQLEDLEWVFTEPGTYELSVHLQGWVRQETNPPQEAGEDWRPISEYLTATSEVQRYVIQVGSALTEVEPPQFGVHRSVAENSPAGTVLIGGPVSVFGAEVDTLEYRLIGDGHDQFDLVPSPDPHSHWVEIAVADGARLDYETREAYDLTLGVTDLVDHENNADSTIDDTLAVRILLDDVPTQAVIEVDNPNPLPGETVTFTAVLTDFGEGYDVSYHFVDSEGTTSGPATTHAIRRDTATTEMVEFYATYEEPDGSGGHSTVWIDAAPVTVTWGSR